MDFRINKNTSERTKGIKAEDLITPEYLDTKASVLKRRGGYIGGVCQALCDWSGIPSIIWRAAFLFIIPAAIWVYIFLWIFCKKQD